MAEQSGESSDALRSRLGTLSQRYTAAAEADQLLADAVLAAHGVAVGALARLDRIEQEIVSAVSTAQTFALDTAVGSRELQRFLIAKQREILAVVTAARDQSAAKAAAVQELSSVYRREAGPAGR